MCVSNRTLSKDFLVACQSIEDFKCSVILTTLTPPKIDFFHINGNTYITIIVLMKICTDMIDVNAMNNLG